MRIHKLIQEGQEEIAVAVKEVNVGVKQAVENTCKVMSVADVMNAKLDMLLDKHDQAKEREEREERIRKDLVRRIHRQDSELRRQDSELRRQDGKIRKQERKSKPEPHMATCIPANVRPLIHRTSY